MQHFQGWGSVLLWNFFQDWQRFQHLRGHCGLSWCFLSGWRIFSCLRSLWKLRWSLLLGWSPSSGTFDCWAGASCLFVEGLTSIVCPGNAAGVSCWVKEQGSLEVELRLDLGCTFRWLLTPAAQGLWNGEWSRAPQGRLRAWHPRKFRNASPVPAIRTLLRAEIWEAFFLPLAILFPSKVADPQNEH